MVFQQRWLLPLTLATSLARGQKLIQRELSVQVVGELIACESVDSAQRPANELRAGLIHAGFDFDDVFARERAGRLGSHLCLSPAERLSQRPEERAWFGVLGHERHVTGSIAGTKGPLRRVTVDTYPKGPHSRPMISEGALKGQQERAPAAPRQRLRALRNAMHLSQEKVAARSVSVGGGISRLTITKIETGLRSITYLSKLRLAAGLGISLEELEAVLDGRIEPEALAALAIARL